jgi:hypothetical protein
VSFYFLEDDGNTPSIFSQVTDTTSNNMMGPCMSFDRYAPQFKKANKILGIGKEIIF